MLKTTVGFLDVIQEQDLVNKIIENFQKFTNSNILPEFDIQNSQITFTTDTGETETSTKIKISRGEESVFFWSIIYTILDDAIKELEKTPDDRTTEIFDNLKYVVIDDPVSSMDDTRIITIALEILDLISKSNNQLRFLITTHHALFFNVLFHARRNKKPGSKFYVLTKSDANWDLNIQGSGSPFAYHHVIISEIKDAITKNSLKKYHFNQFRALLEKTANFLGYNHWNELFEKIGNEKITKKTIHLFSHDTLSELEPKDLFDEDRENFINAFNLFIQEFNWGMTQGE